MHAALPTPTVARVAIAVRQLLLPALIVAAAACDSRDNPTEPVVRMPSRPASAVTSPFDAKGQILVTTSLSDNQLYLADPTTLNVVQLTSGAGNYQVGSWSADFKKITFQKNLIDGLWMMNADGTNQVQLSPKRTRSSVFSPDGKYIAYIADVPFAQVHTIELATGIVKQLTNLPDLRLRVSWSLDGKKILFAKKDGGILNLFTIAPDGTGLKQVTRCKVNCWDGQFSPDGMQIAFTNAGQIATMPANGGKMQLVTGVKEPWPNWPTWSPDGKQLAYERYTGIDWNNDIWVIDLTTGIKKAVVKSRGDDTTPSWSR